MPTTSSPSDLDMSSSPSRLPTSAPSSPPPAQLAQEEARAFQANMRAETTAAARKKTKKPRKAVSEAQLQAKVRDLEELLSQCEQFRLSLTKKTDLLGDKTVDGKALGEHANLKMAEQPKCIVGGTMRDYQLEGLTWMYEVCLQGLSGILADEMGLGKTIQTISLIALLREKESYYGPHLIVAPLSTLSNWMDEFHRWTPSIPVLMYHGSPDERKAIFSSRMQPHWKGNKPTDRFPVVCTSYEMVLRDRAVLSKISWEFIIVDEGHRLKNFESRLFQVFAQFRSATRFLITGTPLQNNLKELWSLLHFLLPTIFTDWDAFDCWFNFSGLEDEEGTRQLLGDAKQRDLVRKMHFILQPLLLRRVKADVAKHLPPKREYILHAPMTREQTDLYNAIADNKVDTRAFFERKLVERLLMTRKSDREKAEKASGWRTTPILKRKAVAEPASSRRARRRPKTAAYKEADSSEDELSDDEFEAKLAQELTSPAHEVDDGSMSTEEALERTKTLELAKQHMATKKLGNPVLQLRLVCNSPHNFYDPWPRDDGSGVDESLVTSSGKMMLLDRLLPALFGHGHRVLIFSQFTTQLDLLQDYCALRRWPVCRIDGGVAQDARRAQLAAFRDDPARRVFLLSTRAGGQGINLASADTVVLFDSDWNPQQDLQAQDRAHRIGQTRPVVVYRLATRGTVEEDLLLGADAKRRLEKLVIRKGAFRHLGQKMAAMAGGTGTPEGEGEGAEAEAEALRSLLLKDGVVFEGRAAGGNSRGGSSEVLSDEDLRVLMDRSDAAYETAATGGGNAAGYTVVETLVDGIKATTKAA